jgi:hypothetical protein
MRPVPMVMAVRTRIIYTGHAQMVHMVEGSRRGQGSLELACRRSVVGGDVRRKPIQIEPKHIGMLAVVVVCVRDVG